MQLCTKLEYFALGGLLFHVANLLILILFFIIMQLRIELMQNCTILLGQKPCSYLRQNF